MRKKKVMLLIFTSIMFFLIAACSSDSSGDADDGNSSSGDEVGSDVAGEVRVALAGWELENGIDPITGAQSIGLNQYLEENFYDQYPNIELDIYQIPWENVQANQSAMLMSGEVDILYTGGAFASQWYQQGLLRDLDDLIEGDPNFDPNNYLQGIWENSYSTKSLDGSNHYGIPAVLGKRITVIDTELFEQWGVDLLSENPTPEEVLNTAQEMTGENPETGEENYGLWFSGNALNASTFVALTHAFGAEGAEGTLDDLANIEWKLNTPEMVKVFEWLEQAAVLPPSAFLNGQGAEEFGLENNRIAIALDHTGDATMSEFRSDGNQELLDRYETALNLGPDGEGWVAVDPFVMAEDAENVEASWEVMKFLSGYETQKYLYENFNNTPTLTDADFVSDDDKFIARAMEIAEISESVMMDEANPFFSSEIVPAVNGFISEAHNGNAPDIQSYLDDLQQRAEEWSANQ